MRTKYLNSTLLFIELFPAFSVNKTNLFLLNDVGRSYALSGYESVFSLFFCESGSRRPKVAVAADLNPRALG